MNPEKQKPKALKAKAWRLMSELIRRKYADQYGNCSCFTCGVVRPWREQQAGHGISGRGNYVLFLEEVIKPQCPKCNIILSGNYEIFVPKLIDLYTRDQYDKWVIESRKPFKRTKGEYVALVRELEARLCDLETL